MKKINYFILLCLVISTYQSKAQLSSNPINGKTSIRLFVKVGAAYNVVKQPDAIGAGVVSFDLDARISDFKMGAWQTSMRFPSLGDVFIPSLGELVGFTFRGRATPGVDGTLGSTNLSSLILGWHNFAKTFISNDIVNVAGGFHIGDYSYGFKQYQPSERYFKSTPLKFADDYTDPSGYYIGLGPTFIMDIALGTDFIFHYEGAYAFTGRILKSGSSVASKNSPNPRFLNHQFDLRYRKFFIGVEYCAAMQNNEAAHAGRRLALITGISLY